MVGPKKTTPPSVRTASGKKRVVVDFEGDDEEVSGGGSPQASDSVKKRKINKNGLVTLTNGVVSMRELPLSTAVPTKGRDDDARTLFDAKPSWGHSYALFTLVICGKEHPVEKARDLGTRMKIMYSAAPYSISDASLSEILEAEPEQRQAYLHGMSKAAQQKLRYALYAANVRPSQQFVQWKGIHEEWSSTVWNSEAILGVKRPCPGEKPHGHLSYFELEAIACDHAF